MAGAFLLSYKAAAYKSYIRPAMLYGCEAWCLKEIEMGLLQRTEGSIVRAMCVVQFRDREISTDLMFMLGLMEATDQLAMANSVRWYGHVLQRPFHFEVEGQLKKCRPKRTWIRLVEEESVKVGLRRKDTLFRSRWSVGVDKIAAG